MLCKSLGAVQFALFVCKLPNNKATDSEIQSFIDCYKQLQNYAAQNVETFFYNEKTTTTKRINIFNSVAILLKKVSLWINGKLL